MNRTEAIPTVDDRSFAETELGQLVADRPGAIELFERLGFDYCCGGSQTLAEACSERGLDLATVMILFETVADVPRGNLGDAHDVSGLSISDLCDHIVSAHHVPLRNRLDEAGDLVDRVVRVHGDDHPELHRLERVYSGLSRDFLEHAAREEELLFPFCKALDGDSGSIEVESDLLELLEDEHSATGGALAELRTLSNEYEPEQAFCSTHRAMMASLHELELDTHVHVHEENNLLFPLVRSRLAASSL